MLEFCGSVIYAWKHFIVTLDHFECWDFTFSAFISIFEVLYLNCNEAQFNVSNAFVVCLFFNYPPKAESCRLVDGVWGCSLLWGSCCRSRFPSAPSFQQCFKFHYKDVILLEGESCHRVKEPCFLLLPSIKFPLRKRKWNLKKKKRVYLPFPLFISYHGCLWEGPRAFLSGVGLVILITDLWNPGIFIGDGQKICLLSIQ